MKQQNIVQKIWSLCNILRGDGVTYYQYVSELSYLLFLKIAQENGTEHLIPEGFRWDDLESYGQEGLLGFYQEMLTHLGASAQNDVIKAIYAFPTTVFSHSENLKAVIDGISKIKWHSVGEDGFGELYSGLIEKSAQDTRSGAGQYFTPRPLVEMMVKVMTPQLGETIQDPATGSGGFLVAADAYVRRNNTIDEYKNNPPLYQGVEIEKNTRRICLMNIFLHALNAEIIYGDALTDDAEKLHAADLILANPPFGSKAGSKRSLRVLPHPNCNKQLAFLQHIYTNLKPGGRAAVVLPDNILFDDGIGRLVRIDLMSKCDLHTILRLPAGIFNGASVKTNVLFFSKPHSENGTQSTWIYDMRTNMQNFGKTTPLAAEHLNLFIDCFGRDPYGLSVRVDEGTNGRFRNFSRKEISKRKENLDITWLAEDESEADQDLNELESISAAIILSLRQALTEIEAVVDEIQFDDEGLK